MWGRSELTYSLEWGPAETSPSHPGLSAKQTLHDLSHWAWGWFGFSIIVAMADWYATQSHLAKHWVTVVLQRHRDPALGQPFWLSVIPSICTLLFRLAQSQSHLPPSEVTHISFALCTSKSQAKVFVIIFSLLWVLYTCLRTELPILYLAKLPEGTDFFFSFFQGATILVRKSFNIHCLED